jgi:hypothetical protein
MCAAVAVSDGREGCEDCEGYERLEGRDLRIA